MQIPHISVTFKGQCYTGMSIRPNKKIGLVVTYVSLKYTGQKVVHNRSVC